MMLERENNIQVSVVIPVYNAQDTVLDAVRSIEAQTFKDYEVIIVDDCSTDGTLSLLSEECGNHQVIKSDINKGPANARNRGIEKARGPWIAFLDADDVWLPYRLEAQMELARQFPDTTLFCANSISFSNKDPIGEHGLMIQKAAKSVRPVVLEEFITGNPVITSTVLVKKEALDEAGGFDEAFKGPEDYDLWIRLAGRSKVLKTEVPLIRYREQLHGLSRDDRSFLPQVLRVVDKAYGPGGVLMGKGGKRLSKAHHFLSASWQAARRGDVARAFRLYGRSFLFWAGPMGRYHPKWGRVRLLAFLVKAAVSGLSEKSENKEQA